MQYKTIDSKFDTFVKNIQHYFHQNENTVLFQKRNTIKIVEFETKKYVVKSFKTPHIINKIVYRFFRESKAKRSYDNSVVLENLEVNTPKPIGYIEFPSLIFFKESYYISEFCDYDFEIRAVFHDETFKDREKILKEFIAFSLQLHDKGIYHIDYSPGNILVKKENDIYRFYIIDVNRMKFLDFDVDLRMKSMSKLTKNMEDNNFMIQEYARLSGLSKELLLEKISFFIEKEIEYLENKKRLKKLKI